ncbi:5'-nucleotidase [Amycolatopsis sp. CB00013]|uniref:5'-nucleotidase n=1 Tax=Amycolatopsis sp. CB00013 TaxID=1703945 RepID=UPI0018E94638|nr:5'-nucleotidase [Amycolatopsis sp. CB00013]
MTDRLVVGVASSALFDLTESHKVFKTGNEEIYRKYQEDNLDNPLAHGVAYPFIRRLLSLNNLATPDDPLVEVIVLSRNSPDTGMRVMRSIEHHGLAITRSIFTQGQSPYRYMPALNMSLFLSADASDVRNAIQLGLPAGHVQHSSFVDDDDDNLRIAFDFDGVIANDEAERVMQTGTLADFHSHEVANAAIPLEPGPLSKFLTGMNRIQRIEEERRSLDEHYKNRARISIVTARNAPSHERAVRSLQSWGVTVNDAFFLGGIDKAAILNVLKPHIFFDDQQRHLSAAPGVPCVHVPFGVVNESQPGDKTEDAA